MPNKLVIVAAALALSAGIAQAEDYAGGTPQWTIYAGQQCQDAAQFAQEFGDPAFADPYKLAQENHGAVNVTRTGGKITEVTVIWNDDPDQKKPEYVRYAAQPALCKPAAAAEIPLAWVWYDRARRKCVPAAEASRVFNTDTSDPYRLGDWVRLNHTTGGSEGQVSERRDGGTVQVTIRDQDLGSRDFWTINQFFFNNQPGCERMARVWNGAK